jgi:hypothetical protein
VGERVVVLATGNEGDVSLRWRDPGMAAFAYEVVVDGVPNTYERDALERTSTTCAVCGVRITHEVEAHWQGWVDEHGDTLSYVPELHDHKPRRQGRESG